MLNRVFISCENKVFTFFHYRMGCYARTSLAGTEQPIWVSRNPNLSYDRQSVSLFFQRMHNCCFLGQILFSLLQKLCFIKFIGTNLNEVIFPMFNWKSSKLCICHGLTKTETGRKDYSYFFNISFPLLEKEIRWSHFGI